MRIATSGHLESRISTAVRIEVSDARGERLPEGRDTGSVEDGGRGLLLVDALATEWGTAPRPGAPGKTVWAVVPAAPVRG